MALYDSADLLARCKRHARRPAVDAAMPDTHWYAFLTEAQPEVYSDLFSRYPDLGYGAPVQLTTADLGQTYQWPAGANLEGRPMGHAELYASLDAIPDDPLRPGDDFLFEGAQIRMLNNSKVLFAAGPYARAVFSPDTLISAGVEPQLRPFHARKLLIDLALEMWAARPGSGVDPAVYRANYERHRMELWTEFATAYNGQAGQTAGAGATPWVTGLELRILGVT